MSRCLPLMGVALALAACGGDAASRPDAHPPTPGNPAPAWEARTLDGGAISLEELRGQVVVLNVWATWCTPCIREMPGLEALHTAYRADGLRVLAASVDRGSAERDVRRFVTEHGITFDVLLDPGQTVMGRFRTIGVPETFLIDRAGVIAHRWIGEFDPMAPGVRERVEALLAEEPGARPGNNAASLPGDV